MKNTYNFTNMPSLTRRHNLLKLSQTTPPDLGSDDEDDDEEGAFEELKKVPAARPSAPRYSPQPRSTQSQPQQNKITISPNDPKIVEKLQMIIVDFATFIQNNSAKAGKFLVDYVKESNPNSQNIKENFKNIIKQMGTIGSPGKDYSPDNIWMNRTDDALEAISKFANQLKDFFTSNNIKIGGYLPSINGLSTLVQTKYTSLSQQQKNENAYKAIAYITNIKKLFNFIDQVPQEPIDPNDSLQEVDQEVDGGEVPTAIYDKIPNVIDVRSVQPNTSTDILDITENVLQTKEKLISYLSRYAVLIDPKTNQRTKIDDSNIESVILYLRRRANYNDSNFKDKYIKSIEKLSKQRTVAQQKLSEEDIRNLGDLLAKTLPLNARTVDFNIIRNFAQNYNLLENAEKSIVENIESEIDQFQSLFGEANYVHPLYREYDEVVRFINQIAVNKSNPRNINSYINGLASLVRDVGRMIDSLLSKYGGLAQTDPRFRSITSHFDSQRAGGAIYDSNMRKITVWNDYFSRQNLGKR